MPVESGDAGTPTAPGTFGGELPPGAGAVEKGLEQAGGQPPGGAPPPSAGAAAPAYCFTWGGQRWGKDYPGWDTFKSWLIDHGADPDTWITNHQAAADCIGAKASAYCFEWGGQRWGKDYPGWKAFSAWLEDHGADVNLWAQEHVAAAKCVGAPKSVYAPQGAGAQPPPTPTPTTTPKPKPGPSPIPTPTPPPPTTGTPGPSPYGTTANAGPFAGTGIMVGTNPEVLAELASPGYREAHGLTWVAIPPGVSADQVQALKDAGYTIIAWQPPETAATTDPNQLVADYGAAGYIGQAESQDQWNQAVANVEKAGVPTAIITNLWTPAGYGEFPPGTVAMPETYVNAGDQANYVGLDYFMGQGASAVVPLAGIWTDSNNAPATYSALANRGLPGVAGFTGDDHPAPDSLSAVTGVGANLSAAPVPGVGGGGGGAAPTVTPPHVDASGRSYCFTWGGQLWGGGYPGWGEFKAWLTDHGASPAEWVLNHPTAAVCIGAPGAQAAAGAPPTSGAAGGQPLAQVVGFTHAQLMQLWIVAGGPANVADTAAAIALAESGGCRYAHAGPHDDRPVKSCTYRYTTGENSYGLWQINLDAHRVYSPVAMYAPGPNAEAAVAVSNHGTDFTPWSTYNTGAYRQYLHGGVTTQPPGETIVPPGQVPPTVTPGAGGGGVSTQPAPSGVNNAWRYLLRRFSRYVPEQRANALSVFANPRGLFR